MSSGQISQRPLVQHQLKARAYSQRNPSKVPTISSAVTIKERATFLLVQPDGNIPTGHEEGYGLYFRDCRFLDYWELRINGASLTSLMASASAGFASVHELSNPVLVGRGDAIVPELSLRVRIEWVLEDGGDEEQATLHSVVTVTSFSPQPVDLELTARFGTRFNDVFEVSGLVPPRHHRIVSRNIDSSSVILANRGEDGHWRSTALRFSPEPTSLTETQATYQLHLATAECWSLSIRINVVVSSEQVDASLKPLVREAVAALGKQLHSSRNEWLERGLQVTTSNRLLKQILDRSFSDLAMLRTALDGDEYFAAGLPWFGTLFGRDSIITAIQTLAYDYTIAERTLRLLARFQGRVVDEWRSEQPGKILHELRLGALAQTDHIPSPYYGSVDATPLFLILMAEHYAWAGETTLFLELRSHVEAALRWIDTYGDSDGDGFVDYDATSEDGYLVNQGWKDSGDAIVNADGSLATAPIALVEVQGYVYLAKRKIADLFTATGDHQRAERLRQEAEALRQRFNEQFWISSEGIYALALQEGGRPCAVTSSNSGQALWAEIVAAERVPEVVRSLLDDTMFTGWGIRTLAASERRYNPVGYHLGTVWPHDNSLIAAGLRKYGYDTDAVRLFSGIFDAATHFVHGRLPELFAGFARSDIEFPAHYPVACHPQAWAAGSLPFMLRTCLGLDANASAGELSIVRPTLPPWIDRVVLRGLHVGKSTVDLGFTRDAAGTRATVIKRTGDLQVITVGQAVAE